MDKETVLCFRDLSIGFVSRAGQLLHVLRNIDLQIQRGETVGLVGESGSGKTHLLHAVHHALKEQGGHIGWLDAHTLHPPEFDDDWTAVLMDDVHLYTAAQQHAAFNWFVHAATPGSARQPWVLAAGLLPPQDLPLREDLRTRLGWGHVFHLQILGENERRAVLVRHAQALGMTLNTDLLDYLLSRFSRDLGHLIDLLHRLISSRL